MERVRTASLTPFPASAVSSARLEQIADPIESGQSIGDGELIRTQPGGHFAPGERRRHRGPGIGAQDIRSGNCFSFGDLRPVEIHPPFFAFRNRARGGEQIGPLRRGERGQKLREGPDLLVGIARLQRNVRCAARRRRWSWDNLPSSARSSFARTSSAASTIFSNTGNRPDRDRSAGNRDNHTNPRGSSRGCGRCSRDSPGTEAWRDRRRPRIGFRPAPSRCAASWESFRRVLLKKRFRRRCRSGSGLQ